MADRTGSTRAAASAVKSMKNPMVMMALEHYAPFRWVQAPIAALSLWLIVSPFTFGYTSSALTWSDVLSGAVALGMSLFALKPQRGLVSWLISVVGLWLLFAPLIFWSPDPAAYANDTLVGALLIAFGLIIPMGMKMEGPVIPRGWSYNPSAWPQRAPVIALAFVSFLAARYMAAYQLGYIDSAWDPFFGNGTERVLTSDVSRAWPVSDAGLGATTYMIEMLMGLMGDQRRWRTMPWMVAGFGFVVVPLGIVSIVLVIMQPLAVGAWCALCLFTAAAMLLMIPLSLDEIVAMIQFVARKKREGHSAWRVFWLGGNLPDETPVFQPSRPETWRPRGMLWGFTGSWNLWLCAAVGAWLLFAPAVFGIDIEQPAADSDHLVGALVIVIAISALAEVARPARFLNVPLGLWLVVAPWFLSGTTTVARWNSALMGLAVILFSLPLGRLRDRYGTFDDVVLWSPRRKHRK
ncbi:MAG: vitamin K epoxide reductase family protein [Gemmatimonadota bacterium]